MSRHLARLERILGTVKRIPPSYIRKKLEDLGKIPPIDVRGELDSGIERAINLEKSAREIYTMLRNCDEDMISSICEIPPEEFQKTMEWLIEEEEKHIRMLEDLKREKQSTD